MSAKTGRAPALRTALAVDTNVKLGRMTSSSGRARRSRNRHFERRRTRIDREHSARAGAIRAQQPFELSSVCAVAGDVCAGEHAAHRRVLALIEPRLVQRQPLGTHGRATVDRQRRARRPHACTSRAAACRQSGVRAPLRRPQVPAQSTDAESPRVSDRVRRREPAASEIAVRAACLDVDAKLRFACSRANRRLSGQLRRIQHPPRVADALRVRSRIGSCGSTAAGPACTR